MKTRQLCVQSNKASGELARDLSGVFGLPLTASATVPDGYEYKSASLDLVLVRHQFMNDGDLEFEKFPYVVQVWGATTNVLDDESVSLFDKVKAAGYQAILVDDTETLVAAT